VAAIEQRLHRMQEAAAKPLHARWSRYGPVRQDQGRAWREMRYQRLLGARGRLGGIAGDRYARRRSAEGLGRVTQEGGTQPSRLLQS
jgi:hypothetical protein